jgi:hypothetical protein
MLDEVIAKDKEAMQKKKAAEAEANQAASKQDDQESPSARKGKG